MRIGIWILFSIVLCGCVGTEDVQVDERGWPTKLRFAYTPDEEEPGRREMIYMKRAKYLESQLGIEIDVVKTTQYGPVIEAMRADKIDIANYSTFPYLIASKKAGAEALVGRGDQNGGVRVSYSYIVVRGDSDIDSIDELKEQAGDLSFAFVNPASTSGHLIPRYFLEQMDINPESDFKELVFPGKHNATTLSVISGKVDAAAISSGVLIKLQLYDKVKESDLKIIWKSDPIPSGALSVRRSLPSDLKAAIRQAHLDMARLDPELNQLLQEESNKFRRDPVGDYIAMDDSVFQPMRELSSRIKGMEMLK